MSTQLPPHGAVDTTARVVALRSQYPEDLLGLPRADLRLTWRAEATGPQLGYQLRWSGAHDGIAEAVAKSTVPRGARDRVVSGTARDRARAPRASRASRGAS